MAGLNCTQFTESFPPPGDERAGNYTIPWLITTIVKAYRPVHYYLFVCLVIFSVFGNFIVLIVLSRKEMRSVGVNVMMMMIAGCDFFCSVWAVIQLFLRATEFVVVLEALKGPLFSTYMSFFIGYIQILSDYLAVAFHGSSLYLGVGMAFCRVMSLNLSNKNRAKWQTPKYARMVACSLCIPVFLIASVVLFIHTIKENEKGGIFMDLSDLALENGCLYLKISLIISGACLKGVPCLTMLTLSIILLTRIEEGKKSSVNAVSKQNDKSQKIDRSSRFIQFVLVVFLVTELPQSLYSINGGLFVIDYLNYYQNMYIVMNMFAFLNSTTSFLVYSTMSSKFRKLFTQMFFPKSVIERIFRKRNTVSVIGNSSRIL